MVTIFYLSFTGVEQIQFAKTFLEKLGELLAKIRRGGCNPPFPATHCLRVGANLLRDIFLRPSAFLACLLEQHLIVLRHNLVPPPKRSALPLAQPQRTKANSRVL